MSLGANAAEVRDHMRSVDEIASRAERSALLVKPAQQSARMAMSPSATERLIR